MVQTGLLIAHSIPLQDSRKCFATVLSVVGQCGALEYDGQRQFVFLSYLCRVDRSRSGGPAVTERVAA